jgi:hypothetical protein
MPFEAPETIGFIDMLIAPYGLHLIPPHRQQVRVFYARNPANIVNAMLKVAKWKKANNCIS